MALVLGEGASDTGLGEGLGPSRRPLSWRAPLRLALLLLLLLSLPLLLLLLGALPLLLLLLRSLAFVSKFLEDVS